ncbi:MAG: hypothetical protein IIU80_02955 [Clostridia bacterium]|nr:hypothetical protein [Clostridia bacterium]
MTEISSRCWELTTKLIHPETGKTLIEIDQIDKISKNFPQLDSYAWIVHDKDKKADGTPIEPHIHLLMNFTNAQKLSPLAKAFNFEDNPSFFVKKNNGRGKRSAYLDSLVYLTHEDEKQQKLGKHLYSDDEVHFWHVNGQGFREYVIEKQKSVKTNVEKYGRAELTLTEKLELSVLYDGVKPRDIRLKHPFEYNKSVEKFKKNRIDFLKNQPMPPFRFNVYVTGDGGSGKGLISQGLSHALINPDGEMEDEDIFFTVGAQSVSFEGYNGQPVIIWDDCRSNELFQKLDSRGNIFNVFDPHPKNISQNIKYGSIKLTNTINIINSVQPFEEFCNKIAGEHIDRKTGDIIPAEDSQISQIYRRFPLVIEIIDAEHYNLSYNMAFFKEAEDYKELCCYENIYGPFIKLVETFGKNSEAYKKHTKESLSLVCDYYEFAKKIHTESPELNEDSIDIDFGRLGLPNTDEPLPFDDIIEIK